MEKTIFYEKQNSSQKRLWLILPIVIIVVVLFFMYGLIRVNYNGNPFEISSLPTLGLVVVALLIIVTTSIVIIHNSFVHLITKINKEGITVTYFSFRKKHLKIEVKEILSYRIRTYNPYREYWGYGVKDNWLRGKALILKGKEGLQLNLKSGKSVLIGTQKKQALEYAMRKFMGRENSNKNG